MLYDPGAKGCLAKTSGTVNPEEIGTRLQRFIELPLFVNGIFKNPITGPTQPSRADFSIGVVIS